MAQKRLRKEWQSWCDGEDAAKMGEKNLAIIQGEQRHWKVAPSDDWFVWEAELSPKIGALAEAKLVYDFSYPRDYPFNPPRLRKPRFVGFAADWDEVEVGWRIFLIPIHSQDGKRVSGRVTNRTEQELIVRWSASEAGDEEEESPEEPVDREWWDCQAAPVLARSGEAVVFHPLMSDEGNVCGCGLKDSWHPAMSFATILAFLRVAVEDLEPEEGMKPVPREMPAEKEMCFCGVNGAALQEYQRDPSAWISKARRLFFKDRFVAPLCVRAEAGDGGLISITCSNLAGQELLQLSVAKEISFQDLDKQIQKEVPRADGIYGWKVALPDGRCAEDVAAEATVGEVFRF